MATSFPYSDILCLPLYVDFLTHAAAICVAVLVNNIIILRVYSIKWQIVKHYSNLNDLPISIKLGIVQYHQSENMKIIDILQLYIPHRDIVDVIYLYLESHQYQSHSILLQKSLSISSLDADIKPYDTAHAMTKERHTSSLHCSENSKELQTLKEDDLPIWRDKDYLKRYLSPYADRVLLYSCIYSICVLMAEFMTFVIVMVAFLRWRSSTHFNAWNNYNGFCIVTALIQPFLRYYKFLYFYSMDLGSYHPHFIEWDHLLSIVDDRKYRYFNLKRMVKCVNVVQIVFSFLFALISIPLLPGAILLMLAIFCFITALGVPFYILYAVFQYFHECYFHKVKMCGFVMKALQQITLHIMILIVLTSLHFCFYSSILSTSVSLYGTRDVVGCLDYDWDWKIHEWHWTNVFVVLSWILV